MPHFTAGGPRGSRLFSCAVDGMRSRSYRVLPGVPVLAANFEPGALSDVLSPQLAAPSGEADRADPMLGGVSVRDCYDIVEARYLKERSRTRDSRPEMHSQFTDSDHVLRVYVVGATRVIQWAAWRSQGKGLPLTPCVEFADLQAGRPGTGTGRGASEPAIAGQDKGEAGREGQVFSG
jgi:hypothetical protein